LIYEGRSTITGWSLLLWPLSKIKGGGQSMIKEKSLEEGYMLPPLPAEQNEALARTPADELLQLPMPGPDAVPNSGAAHGISK
jgi:hypothetical protein